MVWNKNKKLTLRIKSGINVKNYEVWYLTFCCKHEARYLAWFHHCKAKKNKVALPGIILKHDPGPVLLCQYKLS
jgi:hypothetical protein